MVSASVLDSLEQSQLTDFVKENNHILFLYNNIYPVQTNNAIFPINKVYNFTGKLWVYQLNHAYMANLIKSKVEINFLVWDLEWMRGKMDYLTNSSIYRSVDQLWCRSESHQKAIENYCNRKPQIYGT